MNKEEFWLNKKPRWYRILAYGVVYFDMFTMLIIMPILGFFTIFSIIINDKPLTYLIFASPFFILFLVGLAFILDAYKSK